MMDFDGHDENHDKKGHVVDDDCDVDGVDVDIETDRSSAGTMIAIGVWMVSAARKEDFFLI